ncbi:hypothetical protein QUA71_25715 [Microcoleus sp. MON1_C5]|uniref:hypothetical protein n=1 Tax=Microcoleus sp. MON1_C5 TaxID=2818828 RepID=UPI002FD4B361
MTMITSPLKKQEREEQTILLTTLLSDKKKNYPATPVRMVKPTRSLAQRSAESGNTEGSKYYLDYLPKQVDIGSRIYANQLKDIDEEKVRNPSYEIAVYNLIQPIEHQNNLLRTDPKERRGRFLSPPISDLSNNLPRVHKKIETTNHQPQRCQRLRLYLDSLKNEVREERDANFTEKVLNLSWSVWEELKSLFEKTKGLCLEVPDACPGSKDNFMYTWSKSEHYLECEIFGTGEIEFFYRNRNTGEVWGEDTTLEQGFSTDILDKGSLFIE